jgi:hypothetical protein
LLIAGSKQFFLRPEKLNYEKAQESCKLLGMEIATFNSYLEALQVLEVVVKLTKYAYVGMERDGQTFVNKKGVIVNLPWAPGEPSNGNGNETCVTVVRDRNGYNDVTCVWINNFICQKLIQSS